MAGTVSANQWLGRALVSISVGLAVQLVCLTHITPASFLVFAGFGVGPVALGFALLGHAAWQQRRARGREGGGEA